MRIFLFILSFHSIFPSSLSVYLLPLVVCLFFIMTAHFFLLTPFSETFYSIVFAFFQFVITESDSKKCFHAESVFVPFNFIGLLIMFPSYLINCDSTIENFACRANHFKSIRNYFESNERKSKFFEKKWGGSGNGQNKMMGENGFVGTKKIVEGLKCLYQSPVLNQIYIFNLLIWLSHDVKNMDTYHKFGLVFFFFNYFKNLKNESIFIMCIFRNN